MISVITCYRTHPYLAAQKKNTITMNYGNALLENDQTVAQLAVSYPGALSVFMKHNIDYCCGGHRPLKEACIRIGLDPAMIMEEILKEKNTETRQPMRFQQWSSSLLADYIVENHHTYVKRAIPEVQFFLDKVCAAHGEEDVHLLSIRQHFQELADELTSHMDKEEFVFFPAIKRLDAKDYGNVPLSITIQAPLDAMIHDHDSAGDLIKAIRSLSDNYTPPDYACPTYRITFQKLREFDEDLMMHIHLENNILFQRVKEQTQTDGSCSL